MPHERVARAVDPPGASFLPVPFGSRTVQNYLALAAWAEREQLVKQKGAVDRSTANELVAELLGLVQELEQAFGA